MIRLSAFARQLRGRLLRYRPDVFTAVPRCPGCGMLVKPSEWGGEAVCRGCEAERSAMLYPEDEMPFLPEEDG